MMLGKQMMGPIGFEVVVRLRRAEFTRFIKFAMKLDYRRHTL